MIVAVIILVLSVAAPSFGGEKKTDDAAIIIRELEGLVANQQRRDPKAEIATTEKLAAAGDKVIPASAAALERESNENMKALLALALAQMPRGETSHHIFHKRR